ncbi:Rha family transcriptional regulator [Snodgrassella sp. W8132]|uniref:Rha family transcriptional regulator n=1 Tax=Snodgrassella sp. W8132 TaxID=2750994 RepID=UPI0018DE7F04|nr:Rha family transcriptional regulator [Snodgrassella sp. W8132]MBI0133470.1 Rha family transcriptional regulator [Snodgrassella sp. W8132]
MNAVAIDFEQFVQINHSEPVTTSEFVAKAFGKEHKNILRKIEEIFTQVPDSFIKLNFKFNEKLVKVGFGERRDKFYELTKDGFILLVMGFTGKNAMSIKIAYINAFNAIAEKLRKIQAKQYIATSNQNSKPGSRYPTLNKRQQYLIRQAVLDNVAETANTFHSVYKKLYTRFNVYRYQDILAKDFDEAIELLGGVVNPIDNLPVLPNINQNGRWLLVVRNNQIAEVKSLKGYICLNTGAINKLII